MLDVFCAPFCILPSPTPFPLSEFQCFSFSPCRFRVVGVFRGDSPKNHATLAGENSHQLAQFAVNRFCVPAAAVSRSASPLPDDWMLDVGCFLRPFLHSAFSRPLSAFSISAFQLFSVPAFVLPNCRGRVAGCPAPPSQIPAGGFSAPGSST